MENQKQETRAFDTNAAMRNIFFERYRSFSNTILEIPFPPGIKNNILTFLDTAFLWSKEGFAIIDNAAAQADSAATPDKVELKAVQSTPAETVAEMDAAANAE
jgi:hypothetical protein